MCGSPEPRGSTKNLWPAQKHDKRKKLLLHHILIAMACEGEREHDRKEGFHQPGASSACPLILSRQAGESVSPYSLSPHPKWTYVSFASSIKSHPMQHFAAQNTAWRTKRTMTPPSTNAECHHFCPHPASQPTSPLHLPSLPNSLPIIPPLLPVTQIPETMTRTTTTSRQAMVPVTGDSLCLP